MKQVSPLVAAVFLLGASAGLLRWGAPADGEVLAQIPLQARFRGILTVEETAAETPRPVILRAEVPSPVPVAVTVVEEAWDEVQRQEQGETVISEPVAVEGAGLEFRNETQYEIDITTLPDLPKNMTFSEEPSVLIVHTHGSESYADVSAETSYRSQNAEKNVIAVGEVLAETLRQRGYGVIHETELCDYPEYTGAYNRSREQIRKALEEYPTVELVLDLHRDAVEQTDGSQMRMAVGDMAQLMLVVGTDGGGLEHPLWRQNLSLAAVLQGEIEASNPGLMRPINLRQERFNQDMGTMALLVEVGASGNTLSEAKASAAVLGSTIGDLLDRYSGKSS